MPLKPIPPSIKREPKIMQHGFINRWWYPIQSLMNDFLAKTGISAALAALLSGNVQFILLTTILVLIDFGTGVWASKRRGEDFASRGIRQSIVKSVEYIIFLFCATGMANTFELMAWFEEFAYLVVCLTEFKSIGENLRSSGIMVKIFNMSMDSIQEKTGIVVEDEKDDSDNN